MTEATAPRGLYVHVPFCARACPYCDFDFQVGRRPQTAMFFDALEQEWSGRHLEAGFRTVYIGGGTPSLLEVDDLIRLLAWVRGRAGDGVEEWTVEMNPEHVDERRLSALVEAGVDRVSLGVQTFDPTGLRTLGRRHDPGQAVAAIERVAARGLRTSVDLIIGWPGQSDAALDADLERVMELGVCHASVYALTVEPDTIWPRLVRRGVRTLPDADVQARALTRTEHVLTAGGWDHYEISSYGRPGERSLHNTGYWRWVDYVGLGPSAASATFHGHGVVRRTNARGLSRWAAQEDAETEDLTGTAAAAEGLWTGLRCLEGVELEPYLRRFPGVDRSWVESRVQRQVRCGNLQWDDEHCSLRVSRGRWLWHDAIGADLVEP